MGVFVKQQKKYMFKKKIYLLFWSKNENLFDCFDYVTIVQKMKIS